MDSKHRYLQGEAGSAHLTLLAVPEGAGGMCLAGKAGFAVGPSAVGEGHKGHWDLSMQRSRSWSLASPLWSPRAAKGLGSCLSNGSPGNLFVPPWVLWHLCCVHAMAQAQALRAPNSVTVTLLPVPGDGWAPLTAEATAKPFFTPCPARAPSSQELHMCCSFLKWYHYLSCDSPLGSLSFLFPLCLCWGADTQTGGWWLPTQHLPLPSDYQGQNPTVDWNIMLVKAEILFLQPSDYF